MCEISDMGGKMSGDRRHQLGRRMPRNKAQKLLKYSNANPGFHLGKDFLSSSSFLCFLKCILEIILIKLVSDIEVQGDILNHIYFLNEILFG